MTYPATTYAEGVELTITSGNQLHEIINGDATEEINTESGMVPSVRKALADSMLFKPAIAWAEGSVESDPFQTRLYGEGIYWAPSASNETPISMGSNPTTDSNWFLAPVTGGESISRNTNLLSNHNFVIQSPDDITHPSVTPTDYVSGTQVFSGVFVGDDIVGLTYIDGRVSWTSGTLYFSVPNSGALEYVDQTDFVASGADFDGKPRTRGVSYALVGDEYRVTVGVDALEDESANETLLGSVKFEQGKVATRHEVDIGTIKTNSTEDYGLEYNSSGWPQLEPAELATVKFTSDSTFDADGYTIKKKPIKAWNYPRGIKDSAVAGSFMLVDGVDKGEPDTQVTGFNSFDDIGAYPGRDTVALFSQVNSAPALVSTSSTTFTANSVTSPDFADDFDLIDVGMIIDVNFGTAGWTGAVVISKTAPGTLNISSWRKIDGSSDLATTPVNGQPVVINRHNNIWAANFNAIIGGEDKGANQAIGIETGLSCNRAGTGANSKAYYAVNLGGERPEYAYTLTGGFGKGYTSVDSNVYGFGSNGDKVGLFVQGATGNSIESDNPVGHHIDCRDTTALTQFTVTNDGKVRVGKNVDSASSRLCIRGEGDFATNYDETEFQIADPSAALGSQSGFYIQQKLTANNNGGQFDLGTAGSSNHTFNLNLTCNGRDSLRVRAFDNNIESGVDNTQTFGTAGKRWAEIFAGNGIINTSDEREKTDWQEVSSAEKLVAAEAKTMIKRFRWRDAVDGKGEKARYHFGVGAQSLGELFRKHGLNPDLYGVFCFDEWWVSSDGVLLEKEEEGSTYHSRYGVRYEELLSLIISAL